MNIRTSKIMIKYFRDLWDSILFFIGSLMCFVGVVGLSLGHLPEPRVFIRYTEIIVLSLFCINLFVRFIQTSKPVFRKYYNWGCKKYEGIDY